jgi:hypothetical protein
MPSNKIVQLIQTDEEIFAQIEGLLQTTEKFVIEKVDHRTPSLIWGFAKKIGGIKESMKLLFTESDPYSTRILARSQLDHYFKLIYFCMRFAIEKTDTVSDEFLNYCDINEYLEYHQPLFKNDPQEIEKQNQAWVQLVQSNQQLTNEDRKRSREISKKFNSKEIIRYLNNVGLEKLSKKPAFAEFVPSYSYLSSFVHGGAFAEKYYSSLISEGQDIEYDDFNILFQAVKVSYDAFEMMFVLLIHFDQAYNNYKEQLTEKINLLSTITGEEVRL